MAFSWFLSALPFRKSLWETLLKVHVPETGSPNSLVSGFWRRGSSGDKIMQVGPSDDLGGEE